MMSRVYCKNCSWEHEESNPLRALATAKSHEEEEGHTVVTTFEDIL